MELNPYPNFNGNCEEALKFYEQALGGKIQFVARYEGSPMAGHGPAGWGEKIMHSRIQIGNVEMMASDVTPERYKAPAGIQLSLNFTDTAEAERVFTALSQSGNVQMELQKTFWASRFGMVTDRFGIPWMVNCE